MSESLTQRILAIIVVYRPDMARLSKVVISTCAQVDHIFVLDNASCDAELDAFLNSDSSIFARRLESNIGLAAGINAGLQYARTERYSHVLVLDQDSIPDAFMVAKLRQAMTDAEGKVAAVGPQFVDSRNGVVAPFVHIGFPLNRKFYGAAGACVEADFLISSGSLIPMSVLDDVGDMDASLFIDNVDLEWSFRARSKGYKLLGVCDARMGHRIGDEVRPSLLRRGGRFVHSPVRLYYMMRNRVLLYGRKETPRLWVAQDIPRLLGKLARMSLLVAPRWRNLLAMLRGLGDGVRGRSGPMPPG